MTFYIAYSDDDSKTNNIYGTGPVMLSKLQNVAAYIERGYEVFELSGLKKIESVDMKAVEAKKEKKSAK
jgi:hypothetical protein